MIAFSNMSDQSAIAPDTVVTGPVWDMWPTVEHVVKLVQAGCSRRRISAASPTWARAARTSPPAWLGRKLPADVKALVAERTKEIMDGNFRVDINESEPHLGLGSRDPRRVAETLTRLAARSAPSRGCGRGASGLWSPSVRHERGMPGASCLRCAASSSASARFGLRRGRPHALAGDVLGLLGENGAGKTTLMNVLFGTYAADAGSITVDGRPVHIRSSADALTLGIGMVHQHFHLVPRHSVLENLMVGRPGRGLRLDRAGARRAARRDRPPVPPASRRPTRSSASSPSASSSGWRSSRRCSAAPAS